MSEAITSLPHMPLRHMYLHYKNLERYVQTKKNYSALMCLLHEHI